MAEGHGQAARAPVNAAYASVAPRLRARHISSARQTNNVKKP